MKASATSFFGGATARWLIIAAVAAGAAIYAWRQWVPFRLELPALAGQTEVDPRTALSVEAIGYGSRLRQVELKDHLGRTIAATVDEKEARLAGPLEFGTRYTLTATAERPWLAQERTEQIEFSTVAKPNLEGPPIRNLDPNSSVTLRFDRPIGKLEARGELELEILPEPDRQTFKLVARDYPQGKTLPVLLHWETTTGVPVPAAQLEIATAPPLTAEINTAGKTELGLAMPLQFTFSEPLANRERAGQNITVETEGGQAIPGRWQWYNKHRLQFIPEPRWPPLTKISVRVHNPSAFRSVQGGTMETALSTHFTTGPDKRIDVDLATQRASAIENGQVVKTFKISSGKAATPTATGNFYIYARFPVKTMKSRAKPGQKGHYVVENVPYAQYFYDTYAFHGAWWHNGFGTPRSHGCVNLSTRKHNSRWPNAPEDAGWLYHWANLGVPVTVHKGSASTQVAMQESEHP